MIPSGLISHILYKVKSALLARQASLCWSEQQASTAAQALVNKLLDDSTLSKDNKSVMETGIKLSRALTALDIPKDESLLLSWSVPSILDSYDQYLAVNHTVFDNITNHHTNIISEEWNNVANNDTTLAVYSEAANAMGTKQWVVECNKWFETFSISFFRQGGARKHYIKTKLQAHQGEAHNIDSSLGSSLVKDLMISDSTCTGASNFNKYAQIKLLDVGSCYNPIAKSTQVQLFDVTALDLYPVDSSVLQCDFLQLRLGPKGSQPVISQPADDQHDICGRQSELNLTEQVTKRQRRESEVGYLLASSTAAPAPSCANTKVEQVSTSLRLLQLPQEQYDVVTMCLVLNYLPTPTLRLQMVRQARALLRSPPSHSTSTVTDEIHRENPHRTGLLLIAEKQSIFKPPFKQNNTAPATSTRNAKKNTKTSKVTIEKTASDLEENKLDSSKDVSNNSIPPPTATSSTAKSSSENFDYWTSWVTAVCSCGFELVRYHYFPSSDGRKSHLFAFATVDLPSVVTGTDSTTTSIATASTTNTTTATEIDFNIPQMWIKQDHEGQG